MIARRNDLTGPLEWLNSGKDAPIGASRLGWVAAVFALLVQQGVIITSPALSHLSSEFGSLDPQANIFNTIAVALNILLLAPLCLFNWNRVVVLITGNKAALALIVFIAMSMAWSIHPDVTVRRTVNYFSTILTACYLVSRFDVDETMEILSWSIAISVVCSFVLVAAFPLDTIHQPSLWAGPDLGNLAGSWMGAFAHKNVLGRTMAVGILCELYLITTNRAGLMRHTVLLAGCSALLLLSRSSTAMVLTSIYAFWAALYVILQRARQYFGVIVTMSVVLALTIAVIFLVYPDMVFKALGSDPTLTGRTELWGVVLDLIWQRPVLGWGYSALWLPHDQITDAVSNAVGWQVPQAHNAFLEVAVELGFVGLTIVLLFIAVSVWRAVRCLGCGRYALGMFSLAIFSGVLISGITEATLVQNQAIGWVIFNIMSFYCGLEMARRPLEEENSQSLYTSGVQSRLEGLGRLRQS